MKALLALLLLVTPVLAASWTTYTNERFGATIDIPPGFINDVPPPENGDGLTFHDKARAAELLVWGGNLVPWDFRQDSAERVSDERKNGWAITYEQGRGEKAGAAGAWHTYSGTKNGRIVYAKALASCKGEQAVHFRLEYPASRKTEFNGIVARLAASLRAVKADDCPDG